VKKIIAMLVAGTVLSGAAAPVYAVTFKRSWESCTALAEERGFTGTYTRGRKDKARFVRSCRLGTQI
jgi:hypothetical protein